MSGSKPTTSLQPAEPDLRTFGDIIKREVMLAINCHAIAVVQSFDSTRQTVTATISYKKAIRQQNPTTGVYQTVYQDYPVLVDCPAIVLSGGPGALTMPIAQGDECLVLFNDRALDTWFQSGVNAPLPSSRLHSFSDAIVLVGLRSQIRSIQNYDTQRVVLRNGAAKVAIGDKIEISNGQNLKNALDTVISSIFAAGSATWLQAGGDPLTNPFGPLAENAARAQIGAVLE